MNTPNTLTAAIDIGSSAIRMDIAEIRGDGTHIIDSLKKGVQLGNDAFTRGHIGEATMRAACDALRDFKKVMDSYGVVRYRAVATSAVRESSNSDTFLDRVLMSTGLDVEVIDGPEENRLTFSAVQESLRSAPDLNKGKALLVEVGGGSTDVTLLESAGPLQSGTFPIGSIRLRAGVVGVGSQDQQARMLKRQISSLVTNVKHSITLKEAVGYVAIGGDVRFVERVLRGPVRDPGPTVVTREAFTEFVDSLARLSTDGIVQKYSISYMEAETLAPALVTYALLLKETQAPTVTISDASIRAGILQDLTPAEQSKRISKLSRQILSAARNVGRKYQYDEAHADRVLASCELLFDELRPEHRMNDTHRLYLQVAALLHDIGLFVSSRGHHKHSQYLISASGLFGLRQRELDIIANIARYHRRALPQRAHPTYMALERDERMIVSKLAAILRVANALDKEHLQNMTDLKVVREGDQIVLLAQNISDLSIERVTLADRSDLFEEAFGKKIVLREASRSSS